MSKQAAALLFTESERETARKVLEKYSRQGLTISEPKGQQSITDTIETVADVIRIKTAPEVRVDLFNLMTVDVMPASRIPVFGKLVCAAKRLARKLLFWYLQPVFERQSQINRLLFEQIRSSERNQPIKRSSSNRIGGWEL